MATKNVRGWGTKNFTASMELLEAIEALAGRNGRSVSHEISHALERHLGSPPTLFTPEMPPAGADDATPRRKPGRPSKGEVAG